MPNDDRVSLALRAAGVAKPARDRVRRALVIYRALTDDAIIDAVVSEYPSGDLGRVHESIWLFSPTRVSESSLLDADEDDLDFVPLMRGVRHVVIRTTAYDWSEATEKSRIRLEVWFAAERYGELKASGANCDWLRDVLRRTVLPNLASGVVSTD